MNFIIGLMILSSSSLIIVINGENMVMMPKQAEKPLEPMSLVKSTNEFGFNLLEQINLSPSDDLSDEEKAKFPEPKNVALSPFSLLTSLVMLYEGSNDKTDEEFSKLFKFNNDLTKEMLPKLLHDEYDKLKKDSSITYRMVNALVNENNMEYTDAYKKLLEEYFHSKTFDKNVDLNELNKYLSENSENNLDKLSLEKLNDDLSLMLVDGSYFHGKWMFPFYEDDTHFDTFFGRNDVQYNNVSFMRKFGRFGFNYLYDVEADMIEIPFENDNYAFYGLLPRDPNDDLSDIRQSLNVSYIEKMINKLSYKMDSTVEIPRLNLNYEDNLNDMLMKLELKNPFNKDDAKFGSLSTQQNLHLTNVLHHSKLSLNEYGMKKSQQNDNDDDLDFGATPLFYNFNHPFYYFIRNKQTGLILMMGEMHKF